MLPDDTSEWAERRKTTNLLLGTNIVVLAAGFIRLGNVGPRTVQALSELVLVLVMVTAVLLVFGSLFSHE
ncbi:MULTISPECIES: hypothetical protein [unclassified Natrinema]|uniref:hypothetical protein n=1 Tax=unclassified Natrinema TaxID=2622230 RepID=UPI00026D4338|nr:MULTISPECIES: hypothetical protein [unclassified Natrinema]AFO56806.1 hypothetical protein NJ7G_1562 [Natrinema sp. J7-2]